MNITQLVVGPVESNCYIVWCPETTEGVIIDPGDDGERIISSVRETGITVAAILDTHGHFDHIGANKHVSEAFNAPICLHELDLPLLRTMGGAALFGLSYPQSPDPARMLEQGDTVVFGNRTLHVIFAPGHTPGHVCFYEPDEAVLFTGDVLFRRSVGRTDLPGASHADLMNSIHEHILTLPDHTVVYPGHGEATTIGEERTENPWL